MSFPDKLNENSSLPELVTAIRRLNQAILEHQRSALRTSLDLGDALAWARARVAPRHWKGWRADNFPDLGKRRDEVARQLAAARPVIERAMADNPDLSIREALRLITTPKPRLEKPAIPALEKWRVLSAEEKRAGLAADGLEEFLGYLPPDWRDALADRVVHVKHKTALDRGLSKRLREFVKNHPDNSLAKFIHDEAINPAYLMVHVGQLDAPSKRRPPLVTGQASSDSVH